MSSCERLRAHEARMQEQRHSREFLAKVVNRWELLTKRQLDLGSQRLKELLETYPSTEEEHQEVQQLLREFEAEVRRAQEQQRFQVEVLGPERAARFQELEDRLHLDPLGNLPEEEWKELCVLQVALHRAEALRDPVGTFEIWNFQSDLIDKDGTRPLDRSVEQYLGHKLSCRLWDLLGKDNRNPQEENELRKLTVAFFQETYRRAEIEARRSGF